MGKSESTYKFYLTEPTKHFKQGKANDPIEFREYKSNIKLCPVRTLDTYIERTQHLRREHDSTKLFISYVKPHKPVSQQLGGSAECWNYPVSTQRHSDLTQKGQLLRP